MRLRYLGVTNENQKQKGQMTKEKKQRLQTKTLLTWQKENPTKNQMLCNKLLMNLVYLARTRGYLSDIFWHKLHSFFAVYVRKLQGNTFP